MEPATRGGDEEKIDFSYDLLVFMGIYLNQDGGAGFRSVRSRATLPAVVFKLGKRHLRRTSSDAYLVNVAAIGVVVVNGMSRRPGREL